MKKINLKITKPILTSSAVVFNNKNYKDGDTLDIHDYFEPKITDSGIPELVPLSILNYLNKGNTVLFYAYESELISLSYPSEKLTTIDESLIETYSGTFVEFNLEELLLFALKEDNDDKTLRYLYKLFSREIVINFIISNKTLDWMIENKTALFANNNINVIDKLIQKYQINLNETNILVKNNINTDLLDKIFILLIECFKQHEFSNKLYTSAYGSPKLTQLIIFYTFSYKIEYAEQMADLFKETMLVDAVINKNEPKYKKFNCFNYAYSDIPTTDVDARRLIKVYDKIFGFNNLFSITLSLYLNDIDAYYNGFLVNKTAIRLIVENSNFTIINSENYNSKIVNGIYNYCLKYFNTSADELFVALYKFNIAGKLYEDLTPIAKLISYLDLTDSEAKILLKEILEQSNTFSKYSNNYLKDFKSLPLSIAILLAFAYKCDNKDNQMDNIFVKLITHALQFIVDTKSTLDDYTILISSIMHGSTQNADYTIGDNAMKEICHAIVNKVMSNKTKKELLFGVNINVNDLDQFKNYGSSLLTSVNNY